VRCFGKFSSPLAFSIALTLTGNPSVNLQAAEPTSTTQPREVAANVELDGALALLDRWIDAHRAYEAIPGLSVGIVHDQELIWQRGYGLADPTRKLAANAETLYSICSISKVFTGIAVMQQRERGALDLDDAVAEHLEWFRIRQVHKDSGPLTVRSLLTHTSGLPRESVGTYWSPSEFPFPDRETLVEALAKQATLYPADTYFQYSNLGITLAGEIVAARADMDYAAYIEQKVLAPLKLTETRAEFPKRQRGSVMAVGHGARDRDGNRPVMPPFDTAGLAAAAGFTSNVIDLAKFAAWNFRTLDGKANAVLSPASLREMQRVHWTDPDWKTTWGLGFEVRKAGDDTLVGHDGSCPGFNTAFALFPRHKLAVIVLANASGIDPHEIVGNVQRLVVPAIAQGGATEAGRAPRTTLKLGPYTGRYDAQPWSGEVAVVQHGDELRVAWLPRADVTEGLVRLRHLEDDTFYRVRPEGEEVRGETWTFVRDEAGEVAALTTHALRLPRLN
jgi:CubicO group peptidase (beta-lactamase class C family)